MISLCMAKLEQHDCLEKVIQHVERAGMKLNHEKRSISQLFSLGHLIRDPARSRKNPSHQVFVTTSKCAGAEKDFGNGELSRKIHFQHLHMMYELLKTKNTWTWSHIQQTALEHLKKLLTTASVLAYYDSAVCSSNSMGDSGNLWRIFSRCLMEAETRYAQIEKECLAGVWA